MKVWSTPVVVLVARETQGKHLLYLTSPAHCISLQLLRVFLFSPIVGQQADYLAADGKVLAAAATEKCAKACI